MQSATGFLNKSVIVRGKERPYVMYVPRDYRPDRAWPLIVFLHGRGERGDDGLKPSDVGLGRAIRRNPDRFPCLVVMPQCPDDVYWDKALDIVDAAWQAAVAEYSVDPARVYLTGISMGGFGTWIYGAAHVDQFAALVPVCGGGKAEDAARLSEVPIWTFHGAKDIVVPPDESRRMVEAVEAAGGKIRYTEYPDLEHNCWDAAYSEPKLAKWLFKQHR